MKCSISKTSDPIYKETIEINTLEELLSFMQECRKDLILDCDIYEETLYIEIYDGFRE